MSINMRWIGWDGSEWDLRSGPVRLSGDGPEWLLNMFEAEVFTRDTALRDGQVVTGWRGKPRAGLLPVLIGPTSSEQEWLDLERAWWRTMRHTKAGTLELTAPDGEVRTLSLRFVDDGGMRTMRDPSRDRTYVAPLKMVADDPWWVGKPIGQEFRTGGVTDNFFGGTEGFGPPFLIGPANTLETATLTNPGDINIYPVYVIEGPATAFAAVLSGKTVAGTVSLAAGEQMIVETAPDRQVATKIIGGTLPIDGGIRIGGTRTNVTRQLTAVNFAPLPVGIDVPLHLTLNGVGSIAVLGVPRYYRAWG